MSENMLQDIQEVLFTEEQIAKMVERVGAEISRDYKDKNLLLVSVLKGSVVFMADLMRAITIPARIDFMATSSYGSGVKTSGVVKILKDLDLELSGYDILMVEDILDSGKTLSYLTELLQSRAGRRAFGCAPCLTSPSAGRWRWRPPMWALKSPTPSLWGMGWILTKNTATCPLWVCLSPAFTNDQRPFHGQEPLPRRGRRLKAPCPVHSIREHRREADQSF